MSKIRSRFTELEVETAVACSRNKDTMKVDAAKMAAILNDNKHGTVVSVPLARYWAKQFDKYKKNGDPYLTLTIANRELRAERKLRNDNPEVDYAPSVDTMYPEVSKSCLVIPDQHAPYHHKDTIAFLCAVAARYKPDTVINLGDELDFHALSFHDSDPSLDAAGPELTKGRKFLHDLHNIFPVMRICHSNHGSMVFRKALAHGIPAALIKSYRETCFPDGGGERWDWQEEIVINLPNGQQVLFKHQPSGNEILDAAHNHMNLVVGHKHGSFAIEYASNSKLLYWAANAGCLIDRKSEAFAYGRHTKNRPIIGCMVIVDSLPLLVPMRIDEAGNWIGSL